MGFLALVIFQAYLITTTGQSLGKRWLKIRIVRLDGSRVNDPNIVRIDKGSDSLQLVGVAAGRTRCGFWSHPLCPPRALVEVHVVSR